MKIHTPRLSQYVFLFLFLLLFVTTEYRGKDEISLAINSFFRANPLVVISYFISTFQLLPIFLPGIMMTLATVVLGRFFCGWICPLGTIIDLITPRIKKNNKNNIINSRFKYFVIFLLLTTALFGINLIGLLDPIAVLVRFLTFSVYPVVGYLYRVMGEKRDYLEPAYLLIKNNLLPFRTSFYPLAIFSLGVFGIILFLERYEERNWCKNLCPLGTLLGLLSKFSIFTRVPKGLCGDCGDCAKICKTTFDNHILNKAGCILCMDCKIKCKFNRVTFKLKKPEFSTTEFSPDKRTMIAGFLSGVVLSRMAGYKDETLKVRLLRPPGVKDENDFLKKCVRCGECMKICLRNALYPSLFEGGLYGIYTPVLVPRKGYCEYNCTLCGQVCPTKAIP